MTTAGDLGYGQSPIDIRDWIPSDALTPTLDYASDAVRAERTPGFVMIHFARGSELNLGEIPYRLLQLHWHTPAEHAIEGEELDAELHFVHVNDQGEMLVVGVVHRLGEADDRIQRIIQASPQAGEEVSVVPTLSAAELMPEFDGFYHYTGSLTAAPFSEPVQWYLGRTIRTVSQSQVEQLQSLTGGPNARPLQERNARTILCVGCRI